MSVGAIFSSQRNSVPHFASYALPLQTSFCQTAPLLPSVTQQQHVMEYWWEGSISTATLPISTSDIMGQKNKIGGITSRGALIIHEKKIQNL